MRQAGVLAAAALHALAHHRQLLEIDHRHARQLGELLGGSPGLRVATDVIETNIVLIDVDVPADLDMLETR